MAPIPPQSRRYLRAAPRPESWSEIQDTVLEQLGGGDRAEAALRATLERLQQNHPQPSRTGPGRKSNGEHAINFYEYLLEEALPAYRERNPAAAVNESLLDDDDDDQEEEEENDGQDNVGDDNEEPGDDDDNESADGDEEGDDDEEMTVEEQSGADDDDEASSSGTPNEEEAWQHNDLCEVCDGDATERYPHIQCSTCPIVFHLDCVRPPLENTTPDGDYYYNEEEPYVCSYCVMGQGLPVSSKPRRVAAAAVRLMARLRKRKIRERQERGEFNAKEMEERRRSLGLPVNANMEVEDETRNTLVYDVEVAELDVSQAKTEYKTDADYGESMDVEPGNEEESAERKPAAKSNGAVAEDGETNNEAEPEGDQKEEEAGDARSSAVVEELHEAEVGDDAEEETEKLVGKDEHSVHVAVSARKSTEAGGKMGSLEEGEGIEPAKTKDDREDAEISVGDADGSEASGGEDKDNGNKTTADRGEGEEKAARVAGRISPRRNRKQPTIYSPQIVKLKPERTVASEGAASTKESPSLSARKAALDAEDAVWCSFCKDDPDILICVFCACRVCFGKHYGKKLLICDQCDEEYHTFCLDPPLTSVPDSKQWFCPNCVKESTKKSGDSRARRTSRDRRSSFKKTPDPKRSSRESTSKDDGAPKSVISKNNLKSAKSRGPGRPPKNAAPTEVVATVSRKRGRPPKNPASAESDRPRKRGRPSKSDSFRKRSQSEPPRKRGRPPSAKTLAKRAKEEVEVRKAFKAAEAAKAAKAISAAKRGGEHMSESDVRKALAAAAAAAAVAKPPPPVTKSRSGRTVKRTSHYEEIGHGMQMLQTARLMEHLKSDHTVESGTVGDTATGETESQTFVIPGPVTTEAPPALSLAEGAATDHATSGSQRVLVPAGRSLKPPPDHVSAASSVTAPMVPVANLPAFATADGTSSTTMSTRGALNPAYQPDQSTMAYASRMDHSKQPRRKPGARECMQISRRFGVKEIPEKYIEILVDYKDRGKLEHLIRMRDRLDEHSRFLEAQLAGLEALVLEKGESSVVVPLAPPSPERTHP